MNAVSGVGNLLAFSAEGKLFSAQYFFSHYWSSVIRCFISVRICLQSNGKISRSVMFYVKLKFILHRNDILDIVDVAKRQSIQFSFWIRNFTLAFSDVAFPVICFELQAEAHEFEMHREKKQQKRLQWIMGDVSSTLKTTPHQLMSDMQNDATAKPSLGIYSWLFVVFNM